MLSAMLIALATVAELSGGTDICRDLATQLDAILSSSALDGARVAVYVHNLDTNSELYRYNPDDPLVPASNVKLVTTAAALYYLGTNYRFHTEIFASPDEHGVVGDALYIEGNGDPWLVPERVWYLANRLYFAGVRQIRGDIVVDDTAFDGPRYSHGAGQDHSPYAYMAPRGAVSVAFNTIVVHVRPTRPGQLAAISLEPRSAYARIEGTIATSGRSRSHITIGVLPDAERSVVNIAGRISSREDGRGYYRRIDNPPIFAGEVFKQAFKQVGITVRGGKVRTGTVPEDANKLVQLASPRLSELVMRLNKHSNNFMAEQVALATGATVYGPPGNWDKAQAAIESFLNDTVGLEPGSYNIQNASGLHDVNRFSPRQLTQVLAYMYGRADLRTEYLNSLSVAGGSGTLVTRMRDSDAAGVLRAKTGTLSISSALSGYVTAKRGETLAFAILINDYRSAITEVWAAQDEIGNALAATDTRCAASRGRPVARRNYGAAAPVSP